MPRSLLFFFSRNEIPLHFLLIAPSHLSTLCGSSDKAADSPRAEALGRGSTSGSSLGGCRWQWHGKKSPECEPLPEPTRVHPLPCPEGVKWLLLSCQSWFHQVRWREISRANPESVKPTLKWTRKQKPGDNPQISLWPLPLQSQPCHQQLYHIFHSSS